MYCYNCKKTINDGLLYCPECGTKQLSPEAVPNITTASKHRISHTPIVITYAIFLFLEIMLFCCSYSLWVHDTYHWSFSYSPIPFIASLAGLCVSAAAPSQTKGVKAWFFILSIAGLLTRGILLAGGLIPICDFYSEFNPLSTILFFYDDTEFFRFTAIIMLIEIILLFICLAIKSTNSNAKGGRKI